MWQWQNRYFRKIYHCVTVALIKMKPESRHCYLLTRISYSCMVGHLICLKPTDELVLCRKKYALKYTNKRKHVQYIWGYLCANQVVVTVTYRISMMKCIKTFLLVNPLFLCCTPHSCRWSLVIKGFSPLVLCVDTVTLFIYVSQVVT